MTKKLLIDSTHAEEVRLAIVNEGKLEEFESETCTKKQVKGNIYLAKVIRVEPSLQAAFVEYGAGKNGFLPFSEIHPDYYYIPVSDRQEEDQDEALPLAEQEISEEAIEGKEETGRNRGYRYKIQEVIKRKQIMLIQVVKEERGGKGAALTTFLSLAGRYCVLMPNAGRRTGGVSRKISDGDDRKRLKDLVGDLKLQEGMSVIIRTAGQLRSKTEVRRDYEYILKIWADIREKALNSIAPALVYEEGSLIQRALRDIYQRDMDEILIEGENAYKEAKALMKAMIPSHAKKVKLYKEAMPLFHHFRVEDQIDEMMLPKVMLPSGGSIVIAPTEALVAVDVNSGRSTKERHIDETALKTNLEAAEEVARQMRLRDLGGLVVIDFIDMHDTKHVALVEKRLKEATALDRARIQLGRISQFGLLELSRQRLKPSLMETHSVLCPHCQGAGMVRSVESTALFALRAIEEEVIKNQAVTLKVTVAPNIDTYLLNQKRTSLIALEARFGITIMIERDESFKGAEISFEASESKQTAKHVIKFEKQDTILSPIPEEDKDLSVKEPLQEEQEPRRSKRKKRKKNKESVTLNVEAQENPTENLEEIPAQEPLEVEIPNTEPDATQQQQPKRHRRHHLQRRGRFFNKVKLDIKPQEEPSKNTIQEVTETPSTVETQKAETQEEALKTTPTKASKQFLKTKKDKPKEETSLPAEEPAAVGNSLEEPKKKPQKKKAAPQKAPITEEIPALTVVENGTQNDSLSQEPQKKPKKRWWKRIKDATITGGAQG